MWEQLADNSLGFQLIQMMVKPCLFLGSQLDWLGTDGRLVGQRELIVVAWVMHISYIEL